MDNSLSKLGELQLSGGELRRFESLETSVSIEYYY